MVDYSSSDISFFAREKCPIDGTFFYPCVVITETGMQILLGVSPSDDQPRIEEVNGRRVLKKKWWRRNVVTDLTVGDDVTVRTPSGERVEDSVAEIRYTFRWSDLD